MEGRKTHVRYFVSGGLCVDHCATAVMIDPKLPQQPSTWWQKFIGRLPCRTKENSAATFVRKHLTGHQSVAIVIDSATDPEIRDAAEIAQRAHGTLVGTAEILARVPANFRGSLRTITAQPNTAVKLTDATIVALPGKNGLCNWLLNCKGKEPMLLLTPGAGTDLPGVRASTIVMHIPNNAPNSIFAVVEQVRARLVLPCHPDETVRAHAICQLQYLYGNHLRVHPLKPQPE